MSLLDKLASTVAAGKGLTLTAADVRILHEAVEQMAVLRTYVLALRQDRAGIKDGLRIIASAIHSTLTDEEIVEHAYNVTGEALRQALHDGVDPALASTAEELQDLIDDLAEHDNTVTRVRLRRLDKTLFGLGVPYA
jgi:hypothetical protein